MVFEWSPIDDDIRKSSLTMPLSQIYLRERETGACSICSVEHEMMPFSTCQKSHLRFSISP